ncbi:MAG: hypothetical protein IJP34_00455 [Clostridia bacterium]|nr:hypothetical protein [Clostridia bacterium]
MVEKIAEDIYEKSIYFKIYSTKNLFFKKNRLLLKKELLETKELVRKLIINLYSDLNYSNEYLKLALFMDKSLTDCIIILTSKSKNYRETVRRYIWGFHNLPRAFLKSDSELKISPNVALEYYKPYLKSD